MRCPYCGYVETKVTDSREAEARKTVRRRRQCLKCGKRFTTYEHPKLNKIMVIKKDGRREPFDRKKLELGLLKGCEKFLTYDQIEKIVDEVETAIRKKDPTKVTTRMIGNMVIRKLKKINKYAYLRFAMVYKSFKSIEDFEKELKLLKRKR